MADLRKDELREISAEEELEKETEENEEKFDGRTAWQKTKEGWYDKVPLTLRQLDIIVGVCIASLILVSICIALDAMGIF